MTYFIKIEQDAGQRSEKMIWEVDEDYTICRLMYIKYSFTENYDIGSSGFSNISPYGILGLDRNHIGKYDILTKDELFLELL